MDKIKIRYCDYEEICRRFDWMEIEDCDFYAPSIEELKTILFPNIRENNYLLFLLWIEETGIKQESKSRNSKVYIYNFRICRRRGRRGRFLFGFLFRCFAKNYFR